MWLVQMEMFCKCKIHTRFQSLYTKKKKKKNVKYLNFCNYTLKCEYYGHIGLSKYVEINFPVPCYFFNVSTRNFKMT